MGEWCDRRPCAGCSSPLVWHDDGLCIECSVKRSAALAAARDELVRAAVALAPDIASQWDDGDGWRSISLPSDAAAAFCAAVAALARLEKP